MTRSNKLFQNFLLLVVLVILNSCSFEKAKPKSYTIEIKDMEFIPAKLKVSLGDTVIWINKDLVAHDVTEEANRAWTSSPIQMNGSWKMVVNKSADYFCSIHPVMKGKLETE